MTDDIQAWVRREGLALLTDFYELTMMAGYLREGRADQQVCFQYFFRSLPPNNGFAITAGLEPFLDYLQQLRFYPDDIDYLRSLAIFDESFLGCLSSFQPRCTVQAIPEGTLVFPHEPILQVSGSIFELQLMETALLNMLNFQTLIASKAARVCLAADGDPVMEFGLRRAHGPDGGLSGSRAAYIGGCTSTSNVLAGKVYDLPVSGTHAHSWVMSFPSELEAFRAYARNYPEHCLLLVDTYDTIASGLPNAIAVFQELRAQGINTRPAIRLDSGNLLELSKIAFQMMAVAGLHDPLIVASNDLDENLIAKLKGQGAKINAWGVGTHLITSRDCPSLNGVYKLVAVREQSGWAPRMKISSNLEKATDPGRKRLVRYYGEDHQPVGDVIYREEESWSKESFSSGCQQARPDQAASLTETRRGVELMQKVFDNGKRCVLAPVVHEIRKRAQDQIAALPEEFKRLSDPEVYPVILSEQMGRLKVDMLERLSHTQPP